MKILFSATTRSHIGQFHMPFIRELKKMGVTVDAAYKDNSADKPGLDLSDIDNVFEVPFSRSPYSFSNVKAYFALKRIIENGGYDAVHCHTPMGAVVTRLASKGLRKKGLKVIYTAHGFHFYKGVSKKNWLLFYTVEKFLSKYTDVLITINEEDYKCARNGGFKAGKIYKIHGVGVDVDKFTPLTEDEKVHLRKSFGFTDNDFLIIYPADFCHRKNQPMLLKAFAQVYSKYPNARLLLCGQDTESDEMKSLAVSLGAENGVSFLGYRRDINNLVGMSDVSVSSSRQEGLPVNIIEAMAMGNAVVATDVRGNNDLVKDGENGFLVEPDNSEQMAQRLIQLIENRELVEKFGSEGYSEVKKYSVENVNRELKEIYKEQGLL